MLVFYFFAILQIFLGYKSLRGGIGYLKYFKSELAKPKSAYYPFASVIVPCRGVDSDLRENLAELFIQDYPAYEVLFVVDSPNDESIQIIREVITKGGNNSDVVIAGLASESGQKVHNLRKAVLKVSEKSEVFVFVDSDARPGRDWLRNLVSPLEDEAVGCATGYRWFIQKTGGFATHLRSVWNASIASALGSNSDKNFCWGGSTAIRRSVFESLDVSRKWKGTLSDDFALANVLKDAAMPIYFVPQCLTATIEDCSFRELLEFTTRQIKITRVYSPAHFKVSMIGSVLFTLTFWTGILLLFFVFGTHFWITFSLLAVIFLLGLAKAWVRFNAVRLVLHDYERLLIKQVFPHLTLWLITPVLYLYNNIRALFSREILWRGIRYKLESPRKTVIIERNDK